jgi:hypothetical protein
MIKCNAEGGCGDWNHYRCEDLTEELVASIKNYACKSCVADDLAHTTFKTVDGEAAADGSANGPDYEETSTAGGMRKVALQSTLEPPIGTKTKMSPSSPQGKSSGDAAPIRHDNGPDEASGAADANVIARAGANSGPINADILKVLRRRPQFQELRQVALQQPETMNSILQGLIISESSLAQQFLYLRRVHLQQPSKLLPILQHEAIAHSKIAKLISRDPEQFLRLLTEDVSEESDDDVNNVVEGGSAPANVNDDSVPADPNLSAYKQIADKLAANTELLAGYNSADQTGNVLDALADADLAGANEATRPRFEAVSSRQRAIYAQIGLMKVLGLNDADFATLRETPQAFKEFLGAHLRRLVDVQNSDVESLAVDMKRVTKDERGMRVHVDMRKLFGWGRSCMNKPWI